MERAEDCTDVPFAHASFEGALVEGRKSWGNLDIFHEAGCHVLGIFFTVPDASERLDRVDLASACSVGVQDGDAEDAVGLRANVECIAVHLHAIIWDQAHDEAAFAQCAEALVRVVLRAHLKCGWFIIGRFGAAVRSPFLVERIDFFTGVFAVVVVDFMCASAIFHVGPSPRARARSNMASMASSMMVFCLVMTLMAVNTMPVSSSCHWN